MTISKKTMTLHDHCMRVCGANLVTRVEMALQFKQALSKGVLYGDEFRALCEFNPYFIGILARHANCKHAEVKLMADQGVLTSEFVTLALHKHAPMIESDSAAVPTSYEERDARKDNRSAGGRLLRRLLDAIGVD